MDKQKNEFIFGINEISGIFKRKFLSLLLILIISLAGGTSYCFLNGGIKYVGKPIIQTTYSFNSGKTDADIDFYKSQIKDLVNTLQNSIRFYNKLSDSIKMEQMRQNIYFKIPKYEKMQKEILFSYNQDNYDYSFVVEYSSDSKSQTYLVLSCVIEEIDKYCDELQNNISIPDINYTENEIIAYNDYSIMDFIKIMGIILVLGVGIVYSCEIFSKKIKYTYSIENIVQTKYLITISKNNHKGEN